MEVEESLIKKFHHLLKRVFTENCSLDDEEVTEEELVTLEKLRPIEVYENFKATVLNLLDFKQKVRKSEISDLLLENEKLELLLQKSEAEIRTHFSNENQLKIYIEIYQGKIEDLEKQMNEYIKSIKEQEKNLKDKESQIRHLKKKSRLSMNENELDFKLRSIEDQFKEEIYKTVEQHNKDSQEDFDTNKPEFKTFDWRKQRKLDLKQKITVEESVKAKPILDDKNKDNGKTKIMLFKDEEKSQGRNSASKADVKLIDVKRNFQAKRDNKDVNRRSASSLFEILKKSSCSNTSPRKDKKKDISSKKKLYNIGHIRSSSDLLRSESLAKKLYHANKLTDR
ncbi:unnamed protein product [Blepharisma stoltei]|uniref:Uncharacterized protein n=1 Tax=Blepharisma stoltei TaxID=1481888 RepID=A0AAU9JVI2_9CILI|nr:unnamed protein product [Blepharisma stoltei]